MTIGRVKTPRGAPKRSPCPIMASFIMGTVHQQRWTYNATKPTLCPIMGTVHQQRWTYDATKRSLCPIMVSNNVGRKTLQNARYAPLSITLDVKCYGVGVHCICVVRNLYFSFNSSMIQSWDIRHLNKGDQVLILVFKTKMKRILIYVSHIDYKRMNEKYILLVAEIQCAPELLEPELKIKFTVDKINKACPNLN